MEIILIGILIFLYLLPWFIASSRNHPNVGAILFINVFLGWTTLGWFAALIWAFLDE